MEEKILKAELFGFMLGDGWISATNYNCGFSGDPDSLNIVQNDLLKLYPNCKLSKINTRETSSDKYRINGTTSSFTCPVVIAKDFIEMGMPTGKRVEKVFDIPNWILNGSKKIKAAFLSGLYAAEGYTPTFQKNDKTLKVIGFNISKRESVDHKLHNQLIKILNDLGIQHTLKIERVKTCDWNNKYRFDFSNSNENVLLITKIIKPRYCIEKYNLFIKINKYYKLKIKELKRLQKAYDYCLEHREITAKKCAEKFNITQSQVEKWRWRQTGVRLPNSFPSFSCCPL